MCANITGRSTSWPAELEPVDAVSSTATPTTLHQSAQKPLAQPSLDVPVAATTGRKRHVIRDTCATIVPLVSGAGRLYHKRPRARLRFGPRRSHLQAVRAQVTEHRGVRPRGVSRCRIASAGDRRVCAGWLRDVARSGAPPARLCCIKTAPPPRTSAKRLPDAHRRDRPAARPARSTSRRRRDRRRLRDDCALKPRSARRSGHNAWHTQARALDDLSRDDLDSDAREPT